MDNEQIKQNLPPLKVFLGWTPMKEFIRNCEPFVESEKMDNVKIDLRPLLSAEDLYRIMTHKGHVMFDINKVAMPIHFSDVTYTDWDAEAELLKEYLRLKSDEFAEAEIKKSNLFNSHRQMGMVLISTDEEDSFFRDMWRDSFIVGYRSFEQWKQFRRGEERTECSALYRYFVPAFKANMDNYGFKIDDPDILVNIRTESYFSGRYPSNPSPPPNKKGFE